MGTLNSLTKFIHIVEQLVPYFVFLESEAKINYVICIFYQEAISGGIWVGYSVVCFIPLYL